MSKSWFRECTKGSELLEGATERHLLSLYFVPPSPLSFCCILASGAGRTEQDCDEEQFMTKVLLPFPYLLPYSLLFCFVLFYSALFSSILFHFLLLYSGFLLMRSQLSLDVVHHTLAQCEFLLLPSGSKWHLKGQT